MQLPGFITRNNVTQRQLRNFCVGGVMNRSIWCMCLPVLQILWMAVCWFTQVCLVSFLPLNSLKRFAIKSQKRLPRIIHCGTLVPFPCSASEYPIICPYISPILVLSCIARFILISSTVTILWRSLYSSTPYRPQERRVLAADDYNPYPMPLHSLNRSIFALHTAVRYN